MSGLVQAFQEFRQTSKINNGIIDWCRKIDKIQLRIYCLEKDINIVKEKKKTFNSCSKTWSFMGWNLGKPP